MAELQGAEGMTDQQIAYEIQQGGKVVFFPYTISIIVLTFSREAGPYLIRRGEGTFGKALPWMLVSMFFGWWGIPWGLIRTPISLIQCLSGGRDVTHG